MPLNMRFPFFRPLFPSCHSSEKSVLPVTFAHLRFSLSMAAAALIARHHLLLSPPLFLPSLFHTSFFTRIGTGLPSSFARRFFSTPSTLTHLLAASSSSLLDDVFEDDDDDDELELDDFNGPPKQRPTEAPITVSLRTAVTASASSSSLPLPVLSIKEKKELASFAHSLGKKLKCQQVGKSGVTPSVAAAFVENLESNELLKLKVHNSCPGEMVDVVKQLEESTGSVAVGQIGRTVILYRPSLTKLKAAEKKKENADRMRKKSILRSRPLKVQVQKSAGRNSNMQKVREQKSPGRGYRGSRQT